MNELIQVTQSSMPEFNDYIDEIKVLWETYWLTNRGEKYKLLENQLSEYLSIDNISLFANGHLALESIISAMELRGEVITTPFSFVSTAHAIVRNNLTPIFCDINKDNYTIDADKIESLITEKTSAIIPVHVYGNICNIKKIELIAEKYNLKIIYDAAHAFGIKVNHQNIANFGDASMFSFHATKVFNTIEGGAVVFKDKLLENKINSKKNFGITGPESVEFIGGNAKMNEFQAAMGLCNLKNISSEINKRKIVYERYIENLKEINGLTLNLIQNNIDHNYSYFPVLFKDLYVRDLVYEKLKEFKILSRKYFYPLITEYECYKYLNQSSVTPIAKNISERVLTLPLYAQLELKNVDKICKIIIQLLGSL